MLGATSKPQDPLRSRTSRTSREKSLDFHVSLPGGSDGVTGRLARKIRESIARTMEQEGRTDGRVTVTGTPEADKERTKTATQPTQTGCGAWWSF